MQLKPEVPRVLALSVSLILASLWNCTSNPDPSYPLPDSVEAQLCKSSTDPEPVKSWSPDGSSNATQTVSDGEIQVALSWERRELEGVTGYRILRWRIDSDEVVFIDIEDGQKANAHLDTQSLDPDTGYKYWIFPVREDQLYHPYFPIALVTTPSSPPTSPEKLHAAASPISVNLIWTMPSDAIIRGYRILRKVKDDEWKIHVEDTGSAARRYEDKENIQTGTTYEYSVCSINSVGTGAASPAIAVAVPKMDPPKPPENLIAEFTYRSVTLKWDPVDDAYLTRYEVLRRVSGSDEEFQPPLGVYDVFGHTTGRRTSTATTYTDTYVVNPAGYEYLVRAINPLGAGEYSEIVSVTLPDFPTASQTIPAAPRNLTAHASHRDVTLKWDTSHNPTVTGYRVMRKKVGTKGDYHMFGWTDINGGAGWNVVSTHHEPSDFAVEGSAWTDEYGVEPSTKYRYRVVAVNRSGDSEPSQAVTVKTLPIDYSAPQPPATPLELRVKTINGDSAELSWEALNDPSIVGYAVNHVHNSYSDGAVVKGYSSPNAAASYVVRNLDTEGLHRFTVQAVNAFGSSHPSNVVRFESTVDSIPRPPVIGDIDARHDNVQISLNPQYDGPQRMYEVSRKTHTFDGWTEEVFSVSRGGGGHRFGDWNIRSSTWYLYQIKVVNAQGKSDPAYVAVVTSADE